MVKRKGKKREEVKKIKNDLANRWDKNLNRLLEKNDITPWELAKKVDVDYRNLHYFFKQKRIPSVLILFKLKEALSVTNIDDFFKEI